VSFFQLKNNKNLKKFKNQRKKKIWGWLGQGGGRVTPKEKNGSGRNHP
jgi:hypothetical protein